jgi:hypothetical protein
MCTIIAWLAKKGLGAAAGPVLYLAIAAIVSGGIWWRVEAWKSNIRDQARTEITQELKTAADTKLAELEQERKKFEAQSKAMADQLELNNSLISNGVAEILAQQKRMGRPVAAADAKGNCTITSEATKTWNQIQKQLSPR